MAQQISYLEEKLPSSLGKAAKDTLNEPRIVETFHTPFIA